MLWLRYTAGRSPAVGSAYLAVYVTQTAGNTQNSYVQSGVAVKTNESTMTPCS